MMKIFKLFRKGDSKAKEAHTEGKGYFGWSRVWTWLTSLSNMETSIIGEGAKMSIRSWTCTDVTVYGEDIPGETFERAIRNHYSHSIEHGLIDEQALEEEDLKLSIKLNLILEITEEKFMEIYDQIIKEEGNWDDGK